MGLVDVAGTESLMAVGWDWSGDAVIWLSEDGRSWQAVTPPEDWEPHGAAGHGDGFFALGQHLDCQASVVSVSPDGAATELGAVVSAWLSNECRDNIAFDDDECEPASARATDAVVLPDGSVVVVGHW